MQSTALWLSAPGGGGGDEEGYEEEEYEEEEKGEEAEEEEEEERKWGTDLHIVLKAATSCSPPATPRGPTSTSLGREERGRRVPRLPMWYSVLPRRHTSRGRSR